MRVLYIHDLEKIDYEGRTVFNCLQSDFVADCASSKEDAEYMADVNDYEVIILDSYRNDELLVNIVSSSDKNTFNDTATILLTKNQDANYRSSVLQSGIDMCLSKPISPTEISVYSKLLAIKKLKLTNKKTIKASGIEINPFNRQVLLSGNEINLRRKEYDMLEYLVLNKGRTVSKEELLEHVWDNGLMIMSNTVEAQVKNLRTALAFGGALHVVRTVRGFGYRID